MDRTSQIWVLNGEPLRAREQSIDKMGRIDKNRIAFSIPFNCELQFNTMRIFRNYISNFFFLALIFSLFGTIQKFIKCINDIDTYNQSGQFFFFLLTFFSFFLYHSREDAENFFVKMVDRIHQIETS